MLRNLIGLIPSVLLSRQGQVTKKDDSFSRHPLILSSLGELLIVAIIVFNR